MPTRIAPVSFLLAFSMAASLHAQQGPLIQLRGIADVAVEGIPGPILSFSSTGEDLLVEYPDTGGRAPMQLIPGPAGERSRDRGEPYRLRKIISLDSAQSTLTIIERPRSDGTWAAGGRVLARDSVRYVGKRLEVTPEPLPEAEAFATADGITFENAAGMPLKPGIPLATHHPPISVSGGTTGLYARKGDSRIQILDRPMGSCLRFDYDAAKRRVFSHGNDFVLFDLDSGTRRVYERGYKNPETNTEKQYYLIPGHDALLELTELWEGDPDKGSDRVADRSLQAVDLDGDVLGTLSLKLGSSEANRAPHSIVCSQHAVAYVLNDVGKAYVRVYAIVGKSGGT